MAENHSNSGATAIALPKGGGAIQGIGETFQPNLFTGTGNFNIPIFASPGREEFGPQLSLQYSTGNGNGIFGLGWTLSIPRITRKTERGLPSYSDDDLFVLSGAEDLVPKLKGGTSDSIDSEEISSGTGSNQIKYRITNHLPRTEGLFARIEFWEQLDNSSQVIDSFWKVITRENVTSIYGRTAAARIKHPQDTTKIFEWLLEETFNAKGNHISYDYAGDDPQLQINLVYEENRSYAQVYPRRILYGNVPESLVDSSGNLFTAGVLREGTNHREPTRKRNRRYFYELVFDYGDWQYPQNNNDLFVYQPSCGAQEKLGNAVPLREDAFSSFRPGFELRTMRLCKRILVIHHFKELGGPTLVKSTNFSYRKSSGTEVSLLASAAVTGHTKGANGKYTTESMPPVEYKYSEFRPNEQNYQAVKAKDNYLPSVSLKDPNTALVDLFGNGLPDIVQTLPSGFRHWRNKGSGELDSPRSLHQSPSGLSLADAGVSFGDMGGDGLTDLIVQNGSVKGFFELRAEREVSGRLVGGWSQESFKHYDNQPSVDLADPKVRMLNLTGDGLTDVLVARDHHFLWYQGKGEQGFEEAKVAPKPQGLENISFDAPFGRVRLADMSGDNLKDIVVLSSGSVRYWPNVGYGRFGKEIVMEGDTQLPLDFNPQRLFLADLDGSGTADLVYVDFNEVHFWFNQSGNSWSEKQTISGTPITVDAAAISFTDFFGTGTTSLLWSYDFGTFRDGNYKVLDFSGGKKPYLLTEMTNNLGATTKVRYASSTKFYLDDVAQGNFWATPLPFPVQVVEKSETIDHISKTKLVTCYEYHHGFYDGQEREFRGFGRVDQMDTEFFDVFEKNGLHTNADFINKAKAHHTPPVETRTWFHTGAYYEQRDILERYRSEYLSGIETLAANQRPQDPQAFDLAPFAFELLSNDEARAAHRALRGSVLRTEVYAHDGSANKNFPYLITAQGYRVQTKQKKGPNPHAVFLNTLQESISYHYERKHNGLNLVDPRIQHDLTLAVDDFGNSIKSATIAYKSRQPNHAEQGRDVISFSCSKYVNSLSTSTDFRHSAASVVEHYELTGLSRASAKAYTPTELEQAFGQAQDIGYQEGTTPGQIQRRKLKHQITLFWRDDLSGSAPIGTIGFHGLPFETYQLALTPALRQSIFGSRLTYAMATEAGYLKKSGDQWGPAGQGDWWIPSGRKTHDPSAFFLPKVIADPFGNKTKLDYDAYLLFPFRTTDPLNNRQENLMDYRVLQPYLVRDINGNHSEVAFSALGLVVGTAVMGKAGRDPALSLLGLDAAALTQMRSSTEADSLQGFTDTLTDTQIKNLLADPDGANQSAYSANNIRSSLKKATTRIIYDFHRFRLEGKPVGLCSVAREVHDQVASNASPLQLGYSYSDGFGREIQQKVQAEPDAPNQRRWAVSGWTIFNNKGQAVQQFEPFFSDTQAYEPNKIAGVSPTRFYDPLQRVICTLHPDNSFEKVTFDPWQQISWDRNDTVLLEPQNDPEVKAYVTEYIASLNNFQTWCSKRIPDPANLPTSPSPRQQAALKTREHANTPTTAHLNTLGLVFLTIADNKTETLETRVELDIEGNDLGITDPRGIRDFLHNFDMAGRKLFIDSKDAGEKRLFLTVDDQPLYHWDANGYRVSTTFDELRRPVEVFVKDGSTTILSEKLIYGETRSQPETTNSRGKLWKQYDGAGLLVNERADFKENIIEVQRRLLANGTTAQVQWPQDSSGNFDEVAGVNLLESNTRLNSPAYVVATAYDAMNRVVQNQFPDGSSQTPMYNQASLLESMAVQHPNRPAEVLVRNIDYNARGQRKKIEYGNGVVTEYDYAPETFRLKEINTTRTSPSPKKLQELKYTYDSVGNITSIRDDAHPVLFHRNQVIDPECRYTYDALYRLIEANGREHESMTACHYQTTGQQHSEFLALPQPTSNAQALISYLEKYQYDKSGNIERIQHTNSLRTTVRNQTYDSLSNRILTSKAGCGNESNPIPHDANGNITQMPHLPAMGWDYKNQLIAVELNAGTNPDKAYYQYDGQGQRIRKTLVKNNGAHIAERIYLGGYEIYTETVGNSLRKQRDTLHVMDDQNRVATIERERDINNLTQTTNENLRYQLSNHLGSCALELNETAQLISYEEYYPYGGTSYSAGRNQAETSLKRYRYSGKERDDETGLYYYGARYYAPWMGRWMSCDPIGMVENLNLFAMVKNNPIKLVDEEGKRAGRPQGRGTRNPMRRPQSPREMRQFQRIQQNKQNSRNEMARQMQQQVFQQRNSPKGERAPLELPATSLNPMHNQPGIGNPASKSKKWLQEFGNITPPLPTGLVSSNPKSFDRYLEIRGETPEGIIAERSFFFHMDHNEWVFTGTIDGDQRAFVNEKTIRIDVAILGTSVEKSAEPILDSPVSDGGEVTVGKNDSLWSIAKKELDSADLWETVWQLNKETLKGGNPHLIYPGETVKLPCQIPEKCATQTRSTTPLSESGGVN